MRFWLYLLAILYLLSPYDIIPDFLIGGGWVDDILILGLLWWFYYIYRRKRAGRLHSAERGNGRFNGESFEGRESVSEEDSFPQDPYKILEIDKNAPPEEIRAAYRRMANKYHPDKVLHLGEEFRVLAEKRFKKIQEAYNQLMHVK